MIYSSHERGLRCGIGTGNPAASRRSLLVVASNGKASVGMISYRDSKLSSLYAMAGLLVQHEEVMERL